MEIVKKEKRKTEREKKKKDRKKEEKRKKDRQGVGAWRLMMLHDYGLL